MRTADGASTRGATPRSAQALTLTATWGWRGVPLLLRAGGSAWAIAGRHRNCPTTFSAG
jgi:hypothetical protein